MKKLEALQDLNYPVEKVLTSSLLPEFNYTKQNEYAIVMDKGKEGKKIVNFCSKQYELVPNYQILEPLMDAFKDSDYELQGSHRFDTRFSIDMLFKDKPMQVGKDDVIFPKLTMNNSYDGRVKYSFNMGFFRLICSNGMVVPAQGFEDLNVQLNMRHTPSVADHTSIEAIREMVGEFSSQLKIATNPYKELQKEKIMSDDALEILVQDIIADTRFPKRHAEDVIERIKVEQAQLKQAKPDKWLLYNGFNYQLNHSDAINMDSHKKQRLDQAILNHIIG